MHRTNSQMIKREKLSTALLVCYIDRCINLPVRKSQIIFKNFCRFSQRSKKNREPNPFCRIQVEGTTKKTSAFESQTNPHFEHVSQILCANPLHEKLKIDVCDARNNNEVIAFFELPIKQVYNTDTMTIDTQSFPLKSLTEPIDNAAIILRLSLFVKEFKEKKEVFIQFI